MNPTPSHDVQSRNVGATKSHAQSASAARHDVSAKRFAAFERFAAAPSRNGKERIGIASAASVHQHAPKNRDRDASDETTRPSTLPLKVVVFSPPLADVSETFFVPAAVSAPIGVAAVSAVAPSDDAVSASVAAVES